MKPAKFIKIDIQSVNTLIYPTGHWIEPGSQLIDYPYQWEINALVTPQTISWDLGSNKYAYDGTDISIGDWLSGSTYGFAWKIVSISSQTNSSITCIVEDVDRFNTFSDITGAGAGGPSSGAAFLFELADDGLPILIGVEPNLLSYTFQADMTARFRYRNLNNQYVRVYQPSHNMNIGSLVYLNSSNVYQKASANNGEYNIIGVVTQINIPGNDWFNFRPIGKLVNNISPSLPGSSGDLIYLDQSGNGTYTILKPSKYAKPVYIRLDNGSRGILLDRNLDAVQSAGYSSQVYKVTTIAERDLLTGVNIGDQAYVENAGNGKWTHYIRSASSWAVLTTQQASETDSNTYSIDITELSVGGSLLIGSVSANSRVFSVTIEIITPFNGSNVTLSVGDSTDNERLFKSVYIDPSEVYVYTSESSYIYPTNTDIYAYFNINGSTQGNAKVTISYN